MSETLKLPRWMFENAGQYFLLAIRPDGTTGVDGGHDDPRDVATAHVLARRLVTVRPPEGTRYLMLSVTPVPEFVGTVNESAIASNNHASRAPTSLAEPRP